MLPQAIAYLQYEVGPLANAMDRDPQVLAAGLKGLCDRELMALRRPEAYGGPAWNETDFRTFQEEVARASGALAFLQTQHQSAVGLIAKGSNDTLKAEILPKMANGERLVGIGFSQLRRPGPPLTKAVRVQGGYCIDGHVPWVTGHEFFGEFLIGAALPDGQSVFGLVPFIETALAIKFSKPMKLAAMDSARTVTAEFTDWFLPDENVVDVKPAGWILRNDMINITLQGFFAIGCARAGVDVLRDAGEKRGNASILEAAGHLEAEILECRTRLQQAQTLGEDTTEEKLELRAWAIDLAGRCAHAAVAGSGGSANSVDHPAQRIMREAIVFTVSAQTEAIQRATLHRFTQRGPIR